jgi:hypothetical protein
VNSAEGVSEEHPITLLTAPTQEEVNSAERVSEHPITLPTAPTQKEMNLKKLIKRSKVVPL